MSFLKLNKQAFSLVELAVILGVFGFFTYFTLNCVTQVLYNTNITKNQQKMQIIKNALQTYFNTYNRLPRPTNYQLSKNDLAYGNEKLSKSVYDNEIDGILYTLKHNHEIQNTENVENEEDKYQQNVNTGIKYIIYRGILPFKDLNLSENDIIDMYGNYFEYYVPDIMTIEDLGRPINGENLYKTGYVLKNGDYGTYTKYPCIGLQQNQKTPNNFCNQIEDSLYGVHFITDLTSNEATKYVQPPYGLRIKNKKTNANVVPNGSIAYVVVSHGKNGSKTCALTSTRHDTTATAIAKEVNNFKTTVNIKDEQIYEAQNCINISSTTNIVGRSDFFTDINTEIMFYKGDNDKNFDDMVEFELLSNLVLNKK